MYGIIIAFQDYNPRRGIVMSDTGGAEDAAAIAETIKYAAIIVSTVPILALYPFLQKYFTKGVMAGAVKG